MNAAVRPAEAGQQYLLHAGLLHPAEIGTARSAPFGEIVRRIAESGRQCFLPARPVRAGWIGCWRQVAGENDFGVSSRCCLGNGALDFGTRGPKVCLRRVATADENFKERGSLATALAAIGRGNIKL